MDNPTGRAELGGFIPPWVRSLLLAGFEDDPARSGLEARAGLHVTTGRLREGRITIAPGAGNAASAEGPFDCVLLGQAGARAKDLDAVIPWLSAHGAVLLEGCAEHAQNLAQQLAQLGFPHTQAWSYALPGAPTKAQAILLAYRAGYDPVAHARDLFAAGEPERALAVLESVPAIFTEDPAANGAVAAEALLCLLAVDRKTGSANRLERFARAHWWFSCAVAQFTHEPGLYQCYAEFWAALGRPDMARRLLRSIENVAPTASTRDALTRHAAVKAAPSCRETCPEYSAGRPPYRVLFLMRPSLDHGQDVLYDGLCALLGPENVIEFPYKASLHGQAEGVPDYYPCVFDHPAAARNAASIREELRSGGFDLIVFGDLGGSIPNEEARAMLAAAGGCPIVFLDMGDSPADCCAALPERLEGVEPLARFKREMLAGIDYGPNTYPLPLAYPACRIPGHIDFEERDVPVFWAGHRAYWLRNLYLPHIEARLGLSLGTVYAQESYSKLLLRAQIGPCIFGGGFDTVRYWELPAHGCLLLAERPPIRIPHDFEDGKHAVFFEDLPELEEKLSHLVADKAARAGTARAGHAHFLRHHTGEARARQMLGRIQELVVGC